MFLINSCIFCLSVSLSKVFDDFQQAENMLETLTLSFITDNFNLSEDNSSANDDFHLQNITIKTSHPHTDFKKCVTRTDKKRQNLFLLNRMQIVFFIQFLPESLNVKLTFFVKRGEDVFRLSSYHSFLSPQVRCAEGVHECRSKVDSAQEPDLLRQLCLWHRTWDTPSDNSAH